MATTRQGNRILLLGLTDLESLRRLNKLPTIREVLLRFHHHLYEVKNVRNASHLTIEEVLTLWSRTFISTRLAKRGIEKLENIHSKWLLLKKNKGRSSETQRKRERKFEENADLFFDIAHSNAMTMMEIK